MIKIYCSSCGGTLRLSDFYTKAMFCEKCNKRYEVVSLKEQHTKKDEQDYLSKILLANERHINDKCLYCGSCYDVAFSQSCCVKCGRKEKSFNYFMRFFDEFVSDME